MDTSVSAEALSEIHLELTEESVAGVHKIRWGNEQNPKIVTLPFYHDHVNPLAQRLHVHVRKREAEAGRVQGAEPHGSDVPRGTRGFEEAVLPTRRIPLPPRRTGT